MLEVMLAISDAQWLDRRADHHHRFRRLDILFPSTRRSALPFATTAGLSFAHSSCHHQRRVSLNDVLLLSGTF